MPNWCNNTLTLRHDDKKLIRRAHDAFMKEGLLNEFIPLPPEKENEWYEWRIANWGTKWDVSGEVQDFDPNGNELLVWFDSAWAPPIDAYRRLEDLGFSIEATYYEPGAGFVGRYSDGVDDCYTIPGSADEVRDEIPRDLDDYYGISDMLDEYQEFNVQAAE